MKKNIGNVAGAGTSANVSKNMSRRVLAALLALVFALSCVAGLNYVFKARGAEFVMEGTEEYGDLVIDKGLRDNGDGTYDLRMEAYATGTIAQKALPSNSPVDIVMVKDQTTSMATNDVFTGEKNPLQAPTYSINEAVGKYYKVTDKDGEHYYPIGYDVVKDKNKYVSVKENGSIKNTWTADQANTIKNALSSADGRGLYDTADNGSTYQSVEVTREHWYKKYTGSVRIYNIGDGLSNLGGDYGAITKTKSGATSYGDKVTGSAVRVYKNNMWHVVYLVSKTSIRFDYPTTLFYYTNELEFNAVNNSSTWNTYKNNTSVVTKIGSEDYYGWAVGDLSTGSGQKNYTGGDFYFDQGTSSKYNYLSTSKRKLADQAPDSQESIKYSGTLYTEGKQLYYQTDPKDPTTKVYIGDPVFDETEKTAYTVDEANGKLQLYDLPTVTRTKAMEDAAAILRSSVTEPSSSSISAVTFNNNLNAGLSAAKTELDAKGTGNKQIIVVFTDAETAEVQAAKATSDTLEESGVTIYTVGISNDSARGTLEKLSSEYYGSTDAPKPSEDETQYAFYGNSIPDINNAVASIAQSMTSPTVRAKLDANWVLKDIISENFDLITKKGHVDLATVNGRVVGDEIQWNQTSEQAPDSVQYSWNGKTLSVTGFDFGEKYIAAGRENGQKLVVTIYGLRLADFVSPDDGKVYSNEPASGLYKSIGDSALFAAFPRPSLPYDESWNTTTDDASLTATEVRISKHLKVIAGTVLEEGSKVDFKVQLRSIEDEYYVDGDENHSFAKHDADHTEEGALSEADIKNITVPLSLQTVGRTPKEVTPPGHYSQGSATNGVQTYVFGTGNILDEIIFPHAGWYVFDLSEDTSSFKVNGDTLANHDENIQMAGDPETHYTMKVYVENQGSDNRLVVTNATVRRGGPYTLTYNEDGTVKTRTLGAPGAEDADSTDAKVYLSKDRDQNGVTFQNEYLEPQDGQDITITKMIDVETDESTEEAFDTRPLDTTTDRMDPDDETSGLLANESFHFMAIITVPEGLNEATGGFIKMDRNKVTVTKSSGSTLPVTTTTTPEKIDTTIEQAVLNLSSGSDSTGTELYVYANLKHGETLTLAGLPAGASYIVREDDAKADGSEDAPFRQKMTKGTSTGSIGDSHNAPLEIEVTNTKLKKEIPLPEPEGLPTNVSLGIAGALIALAFLTAGAFFLRSKLKEEEL